VVSTNYLSLTPAPLPPIITHPSLITITVILFSHPPPTPNTHKKLKELVGFVFILGFLGGGGGGGEQNDCNGYK